MASRRRQWQYEADSGPEQEYVSRSQRKRDSTALQVLGEQLASLAPPQWDGLPLPPELRSALEEYRRLSNREARRRHLQYIGRLMREAQKEGTLQPLLDHMQL